MVKIIRLADKFAMKLSLESRPSSPLAQEVSDMSSFPQEPEPSEESLQYMDKGPHGIKYWLRQLQAKLHHLNSELMERDFPKMLEIITDTFNSLDTLKGFVEEQIEKDEEESIPTESSSSLEMAETEAVPNIPDDAPTIRDVGEREASNEFKLALVVLGKKESALPPKSVTTDKLHFLNKEEKEYVKQMKKDVNSPMNPPPFIADKKKWREAKKSVKKYWNKYKEPYSVVIDVYKKMSGKFKKKSKK